VSASGGIEDRRQGVDRSRLGIDLRERRGERRVLEALEPEAQARAARLEVAVEDRGDVLEREPRGLPPRTKVQSSGTKTSSTTRS
jgi:hypothetical protein